MTELKNTSRADRVARGVFDFEWANINATITIDGGGKDRDLIEIRKQDLPTLVDRCSLRVSEPSRKRLINSLVEKGFLPRDDTASFVGALNQFFIDEAPELTKLASKKEKPAGVGELIENDLDPRLVFDNLDRALSLAKDPKLLPKTRTFIRSLWVAPSEASDALIFHQASVCAPPIRRYSNTTNDHVPERGTETLLVHGLSGSGKGALLKLLRLFGVRIAHVGRITRAAIERSARELFNHATIFFPEITAIYAKNPRGEQIDTDVAQSLRQAIEDHRITLVLTEKDEAGNPCIRVYDSGPIFPAPIMTTIEEVEDIQMRTRALPIRLPDTVGGYLEIGQMIADNIMLSEQELAARGEYDGLCANDVKLIFQLINCMNEGLLLKFYNQLGPPKQAEINKILEKHGLTLDSLKPIAMCEMTDQQRNELLRRWMEVIVVFVLPSTIEFTGEDSKPIGRKDLFEKLRNGQFDEVRDIATALGKDAKSIEGISRDLWSGLRRAQSSGLLHAFQRKTRLTENDEARVLMLDDEDIRAGGLLLDRLAVERLQVELPPREKEIIMFVARNTNEENKLTALEVAERFYGERGEKATKGRQRYIQRILSNAAHNGYIYRDTSEKTHRFYANLATIKLQFGIKKFVGVSEGELCARCKNPAKIHQYGSPLCKRCAEEERSQVGGFLGDE